MSGLRPSTSGVYDNGIDFRPLIAPERALPHLFRQAGYFVHGAGKIYHESYRRASEWEHYLEKERAYPPLPPGRSDGVGGERGSVALGDLLLCKQVGLVLDLMEAGQGDLQPVTIARKELLALVPMRVWRRLQVG